MTRNLQNQEQVSVCYKNSCVQAKGDNAKMITMGLTLMFVLIGFAAVLRAA